MKTVMLIAAIAVLALACKGKGKDATGGSGSPVGSASDQPAGSNAPQPGGDACKVTSTFQGQPGSLWVPDKKGVFTVYDTQTGALVRTVTGPGWSSGLVGGNGLVWLNNLNNDRDLTPVQPSGQALPALGIKPEFDPVFANGSVWTIGSAGDNVPNVYSITSPTALTKLRVEFTAHAFAVSSEGVFFIGAPFPGLNNSEVAHVDAADTKIVWKVSVASVPGVSGAMTSMAAVPGKVFVAVEGAPSAQIFTIDTATHAVSAPVTIGWEAALPRLMTDGVGLYTYCPDGFCELDQTTFTPKRTLPMKAGPDDQFNPGELIAAGALWQWRRCGGNTYVRRIDLAAWTAADILYPPGESVGRYAYLPP
jgi:outer membrane protein assembly factor BamB